MVELSLFNWLLIQLLPRWHKEPVVEIYDRFTNQIITKNQIVVIDFNNERWSPWESYWEVNSLIKNGIWLIILVILSIVEDLFTASNVQIRVTWGVKISGS